MGFGGAGGVQGDRSQITLQAMQEVGKDTAEELKTEQQAANKSAQLANAQTAQRSKVPKKKKTLKSRLKTVSKAMKMGEEKRLLPVKHIKDKADEHAKKNPELKAKVLQLLRQRIKPGAKAKDIQETLEEFYPDPTLADDALDFLLDTTEGELYQQVEEAKEELAEQKGREIQAGRNISTQARQAADKGMGTPTSLRDMYRDITGNPRDANTLFGELANKYAYKELKKVLSFLLHSLGADMKAKGPSIPRGELHNLMTETRTMQAILGVYRFFNKRMALTNKLFNQAGLNVPKQLTFESLSKAFMSLAGERYPSSDKVLTQAKRLNIDHSTQAKIIAFSQIRDSVREMAMNQIYRSVQHRDELLMAIIEALEDLEDQLDEEIEIEELNEIDIKNSEES